MKKILLLMLLSIATQLNIHAEIHSSDLIKYVENLLARNAYCIHLATTRNQRNLTSAQEEAEIKDCETSARLLKEFTAQLDKIVKETDEKSNPDDILFSGNVTKNISIHRSEIKCSESLWQKLFG